VHLIDDQIVPRRNLEVVRALPVEGRVVDDAVAHRTGNLAGVGIDTVELRFAVDQQKLVLVARLGAGYIGGPIAVAFENKGVGGFVPFVEVADNEDLLRVGCPDAEGRAFLV